MKLIVSLFILIGIIVLYESKLCRKKVKDLWSSYGPFDFSEQSGTIKSEYCTYSSCGQGFHHIIVSDIRKWIG
ncbi:MAG: hypothetical protein ACMUJM_19705 [bacterium]